MTLLSTQQDFERHLQRDSNGRHIATFAGCWMQSCFQPIFYRSGGIFGYEALLRVHDIETGNAVRPDLFLYGLDGQDQVNADRLARVIHIRNFAETGLQCCLSLNVMPQTIVHEAANFASNFDLLLARLAKLGVDSGRVIFEVLEYEVEAGDQAISDAMRVASAAGFGIAVDDYGAMAAGNSRIQILRPDIIKIDRSMLLDHMQGDSGRLAAAIRYGWELGSRMLVEGIETEAQLLAMRELGVELYQGFHLGRPQQLDRQR